MAIVKMKELQLLAPARDRETLLRELQQLGCIELREMDPREGFLPVSTRLPELRSVQREVQNASAALQKWAPQKGSFLAPRKPIPEKTFWDERIWEKDLDLARAINAHQQAADAFSGNETQLAAQRLNLLPWRSCTLPLEERGTRFARLLLGMLPAKADLSEVTAGLAAAAPEAELFLLSEDKDLKYTALLCHEAEEKAAVEFLRTAGFSQPAWKELRGTAEENILRLDQETAALQKKREAELQAITAMGGESGELAVCEDRLAQYLAREEAAERLRLTGSVVLLQGWIPAERETDFRALMDRMDCAWEVGDPTEEEYPDVPVQLKNNRLTRPLNMVTNMYSLPAYGTVDPNPLMAPFFYLFYGIMLADMGYGLLMIIAALVVLKKKKPIGGGRDFFELMLCCGISTLIWGAITGGFFGDFIPQIAKIINPNTTLTALPALFTPLNDTLMVLIGAMCLGFVQINTGMAVSFVEKLRHHQYMDAIWEEGTWWMVFLGGGLAILGVTKYVLYLALLMILVGSGWSAKGFGKVTAVFASLYNHVTGYFGDILSYSRLMALMLAGSVIAQVFNTLGAIPGNLFIFLVISLLGNALNFALNLLGCYVHDLRLQCLEYFGKFYQDGGKKFQPLAVNTKYVDIETN